MTPASTLLFPVLLLSSVVAGWPLWLTKRAVIGHDQVVGLAQAVPSGNVGQLMLKYKPFLRVESGCVPFPAVDASGNTGGGLQTSGDPAGGCSSSPGQVYARAGTYNNRFGIMYSWYMPKDSPSSGLGHRHEWEAVVVWLSSSTATDPTILGVSASAHGDFQKNTSPSVSGTGALVRYYNTWPVNHQLGYTTSKGGQQPLIAWDSLPAAARTALTNTDFGDATVPFKESTFQGNLQKAF